MARGGRRAGNRGTQPTNRTDIHQPLPVSAPTGLPYGARGELVAAQQAVPMGPGPTAGGPPSAPGGEAPAQSVLPLGAPTQRPDEPVTAGLPIGPGPGPEALTQSAPRANDPLTAAVGVLNALGPAADSETGRLRDAMNATLTNRSVP